MSTRSQHPVEPERKRYRLRPAGCCDAPRTVLLTEAEAAPGLAKGLLTLLPEPTLKPHLPQDFEP